MKPRITPSAIPNAPIVVPTVTNTLIIPRRLAPIVRRMAISRVLARTSMISDDNMLNTATSTISDSTTNIAIRSTSSASNKAEFICRQSTIWPLPFTIGWSGARISPTLSGLTVWTSTIPTLLPIIRKFCASSSGMMTKVLSYS